ncbi:MAG: CvpA family protein [Methylococcales bacterium]|nr:CvpA family protein [Methylococcales bacterium]
MKETQFILNLSDINPLDGIVYLILIISAVLSFSRGLTNELTTRGAWAFSALVTLFSVNYVAQFLMPYLKSAFLATIVATAGTFVLAFMVLTPIKNSLAKKYMRPHEEVGATDNIVGLGFGLLKGWLLVTLSFLFFTIVKGETEEEFPPWVITATTLPVLEVSVKVLARGMPEYINIPTTVLSKEREATGFIEQVFSGKEVEQLVDFRIPGSYED